MLFIRDSFLQEYTPGYRAGAPQLKKRSSNLRLMSVRLNHRALDKARRQTAGLIRRGIFEPGEFDPFAADQPDLNVRRIFHRRRFARRSSGGATSHLSLPLATARASTRTFRGEALKTDTLQPLIRDADSVRTTPEIDPGSAWATPFIAAIDPGNHDEDKRSLDRATRQALKGHRRSGVLGLFRTDQELVRLEAVKLARPVRRGTIWTAWMSPIPCRCRGAQGCWSQSRT